MTLAAVLGNTWEMAGEMMVVLTEIMKDNCDADPAEENL